MLKLNDKSKLKYFIKKYNINNLFTTNMEEYMDLYFLKKDLIFVKKVIY